MKIYYMYCMNSFAADINECEADVVVCGPKLTCINTEGSYMCVCYDDEGMATRKISCLGKFFFIEQLSV